MRKIIIDCDPGIDDAVAIFLAFASPDDVQVLGLTSVKGNVALDKTHANARRLLAAAGRSDVPVLRGLARPILAPETLEASSHGADGLGGLHLPDPDTPSPDLSAVDFIRQQATLFPGEVTVCAIGPMTNLAVALLAEPALARKLHSIVFMGGAAFCPSNINAFAEFNAMVDPHAAQIVLRTGADLAMVGLDVTMKAKIEDGHLERMRQNGNRCSMLAARLLEVYAAGDRHLHDPCALAWVLDPTLFGGVRAQVGVVTDVGPEFGRTVAVPDPEGNCFVVTEVDRDRLFGLLVQRLAVLH